MKSKNLIDITIYSIPPSVNHYVRTTRKGIHFKTQKARKFQEELIILLKNQWNNKPAYNGKVSANLIISRKDKRSFDLDNCFKCVLDCLQLANIIINDNQIVYLTAQKIQPANNSQTQIILQSIE